MKVLPPWVWENDPQELPDADHARCIAARGERFLACGGQLFALTTRPSTCLSAPGSTSGAVSFSSLQMEYLGLDWPRGLAQQYWGGEHFDNDRSDGDAQQAAGLALLATVAGALAAGPAVHRESESASQVGCDDFRQPSRPPGWPPRRYGRRAPYPALLPLTVVRGGESS